jgi:ATP-grasp domain
MLLALLLCSVSAASRFLPPHATVRSRSNHLVRNYKHSTSWGSVTRVRSPSPTFAIPRGGNVESTLDQDGFWSGRRRAIVIMDGFCDYHSGYFKARIKEVFPDVIILPVLSDYLHGFLQQEGKIQSWHPGNDHETQYHPRPRTMEEVREWFKERLDAHQGTEAEGLSDFQLWEFVGVYCESDSGLEDAEHLRELLQVSCSDEPIIFQARRHKHLMQLTVAERAGLRIAKQKLCSSELEIRAYAQSLLEEGQQRSIIVKPIRGVASESVALCASMEEVQQAWNSITSSQMFGASVQHTSVLVQEYLRGTEYAVDVVSRNGQHKVTAVWKYDKRSTNGAPFCYYRSELVDAVSMKDEELFEDICSYVTTSLSALGVRYGVSHNEVIVPIDHSSTNRSDHIQSGLPYLIEVNCRQHNMDFIPLMMACIGYNTLDVTLVAYLGDDGTWDKIPNRPTLRRFGCMVHLVNSAKPGKLVQNFHLQDMVDLPSVYDCEVYSSFCSPGSYIKPTIDIRSDAGWAQLINENADVLQRDYEQIVQWMPLMFQTDGNIE